VKPPLNSVETLASSADDFISYYSRALQGKLFNNAQTVNEFRRIPILADAIFLATLPLGGSAFAKGGSIDVPDFHCLCIPGGMFFNNHWVYFAFTINWHAAAETDPDTVAAFARSPTRPWSSCSTHFRFRKSPSAAREDVVLTHDCETFAKSIEECLGDGAVVFFVSLVLADCAPGPEITAHAHALAA
jgi:hypothetical protein